MGMIKRVRDILSASINDILDKIEDPIAMLNQYMRDMESEMTKAEEAVARQAVLEKKWQHLIEEMETRANKRQRQARLAVENGDDDIARQALADKEFCEQKIAEYRTQLDDTKAQKRELLEQLLELKDKYAEMRHKKWRLIARVNVAEAMKQMNVAMSSVDTESAAKGFSRIEERVLTMEAEAQACRHVRETFRTYLNSVIPANKYSDQVEAELKKLKAEKQNTAKHNESSSSLSE